MVLLRRWVFQVFHKLVHDTHLLCTLGAIIIMSQKHVAEAEAFNNRASGSTVGLFFDSIDKCINGHTCLALSVQSMFVGCHKRYRQDYKLLVWLISSFHL